VLVFGKRIIEKTSRLDSQVAATTHNQDIHHPLKRRHPVHDVPAPDLPALKQLLWDKVGIIRSREGLAEAADTLATWQESLPLPVDRPSHELANLVLTGRLVTEAALLRQESRGAHFRSDFPRSSPAWKKHIVLAQQGG
jgi:L-aspartate oxidase